MEEPETCPTCGSYIFPRRPEHEGARSVRASGLTITVGGTVIYHRRWHLNSREISDAVRSEDD